MLRRQFALAPLALGSAFAQQGNAARLRRLDDQISGVAGRLDARLWLYAKNLDTGMSIGRSPDERVRTASTIKLPIMAAVFHLVNQGKLRWEETLTLREEDRVSGSGVLREFSTGVKLPLRDVVRMMIVVSDNTATNMVLERITADAVNEFSASLGLKDTLSLRKVRGDGNQLKAPTGWSKAGLIESNQRYGLGISTAREMVTLLEKLERGEVVNAEASKEMLSILERQQYKDGIGRRTGDMRVVSKSGSLNALRSDVGIVYSPGGHIAMAITVDDMKNVDYSEDNAGLSVIADIAKALVAGLAKPGA